MFTKFQLSKAREMCRIALLILIVSDSLATSISLSPIYYHTNPSLINATTQPSLIDDSSVEFEKSKAVRDLAAKTANSDKTNMFELLFSGDTFVNKLFFFVNNLIRYSAHTAIVMMQGVTLVLVIVTFMSVLCSYTSYCSITYEKLQVIYDPVF